jgi:hypothetical protein
LGVITNRLYKAFMVDEEQWKLSVMALFNIIELVFWELMQLEGTENWRRYVRIACTIGVLVVLLVQFVPNVQLNEEEEGEGQSSHHSGGEEEGGQEEEGGEEDGGAEEEQEADDDAEQEDEAIGVVDGGEEDQEVLMQYNGEIDDNERALEDDSLDDEDESITPSEWESYCDNPPRKIPYYRLRPIHFGH